MKQKETLKEQELRKILDSGVTITDVFLDYGAVVEKNKKKAFISFSGEYILGFDWDMIDPTENGIWVGKGKCFGFFSKAGRQLIPCVYLDAYEKDLKNGNTYILVCEGDEGFSKIYTLDGEILLDGCSDIYVSDEGVVLYMRDDERGESLGILKGKNLEILYHHIEIILHQDFIQLKKGRKFALLNKYGEMVADFKWKALHEKNIKELIVDGEIPKVF